MIYVICKYHLYGDDYPPYRYAKTKEAAEEWVRENKDTEEHRGNYIIEEVERI